MNTNEIATLIMERLNWKQARLAAELGVTKQTLSRKLQAKNTMTNRNLGLNILSCALKNGLEPEVLSFLLEKEPTAEKVSSALRAAILYPDLKPAELEALLRAEEAIDMSPLPRDVIRSVVEKCRRS